jgi:carbonic anhydrase
MDGRVQRPVIEYLRKRFKVDHVDSITEPGPNLILAENENKILVQSILDRVLISVEKHGSKGIAVVGHHDCAGNPAAQGEQYEHLVKAVMLLRRHHASLEIIRLWVDRDWKVQEVVEDEAGA